MPLMLERENRMLVANAGNGCGAASPTIAAPYPMPSTEVPGLHVTPQICPPDAPATSHLPYPD